MPLPARIAAPALLLVVACGEDVVDFEGQLGRPIPLASGDASPLPRLSFIDEGCPGDIAVGGCPATGERTCEPLLVDSLAPLTAIRRPLDEPGFALECLEVRSAAGLAAETPAPDALAAAVARFRFHDLPLVQGPENGTEDWTWTAGDAAVRVEPGGVLGGNLLRQFAVRFRSPRDAPASLTFYGEFPGDERELADEGRAYLALQFPGRLLGRDIGDQCEIGGSDCSLDAFDFQQSQPEIALKSSLMVLDSCVSAPACEVQYRSDPEAPLDPGRCDRLRGPDAALECARADDPALGGAPASLVVATGVSGLVLFGDSARRMFGDPDAIPSCDSVAPDTRACLAATDGELRVSGWPPAGIDAPLHRLRVRSLGLVPGLTQTRDPSACVRVQQRQQALLGQCNRFVESFRDAKDIRNTTPPYSAAPDGDPDPASTSVAILGESRYLAGQTAPDTARWIETMVVPETHPLALSVRRLVAPEAVQPDGLLGTALFDDTVAILDYTDVESGPGVRLSCLDPRSGDCLVAPECEEDAQPACCFGLPLELLVTFIVEGEDDTCCGALSASELAEIQQLGRCLGVSPP